MGKLCIAVVGGGASGYFASIRAAEFARSTTQPVDIRIFESKGDVLTKVRISGGGRCNVTHHQFDPTLFCQNYPRGNRELRSPMQQFQASDTVRWFRERGIEIIAEADGRMFPKSNRSETIIDCFTSLAKKLEIEVQKENEVQSIEYDGKFRVNSKREQLTVDRVLIATGSSKRVYQLAKSLGQQITDLAPSLFSFKIKSPLLTELSGTAFERSVVTVVFRDGKTVVEEGASLITHWGMSGPAVLKLSAWAAREMKAHGYRAILRVNWLGLKNQPVADELVGELSLRSPKAKVIQSPPSGLSKRFWSRLVEEVGISSERRWNEVSKKQRNQLSAALFRTELEIVGKNRFKDEFVECGGIDLKEVNFKTMESKLTPGLFFAGEILDIDGITGGFNFQSAWTTAWIAGKSMVKN